MSRFVTLVLLLCTSLSFEIEAQSLCNSPNVIQNGFKLDANVGCSPFKVVPQDQSGWAGVKYIFDYRGQPATELGSLNPGLQDVLFNGANDQPKTYTILQYGKDASGVEKYSCQNLVVRKDNQPKFSYTICTNRLEIAIPTDVSNDFDYYQVDWGNGPREVKKKQIPFTGVENVTYPTTIKVEGFYDSFNLSCGAVASKEIKALTQANYPNGFELPYDPNIDSIQMKSEKLAIINFRGSLNSNGYNLQMREEGEFYPSQVFRQNVIPGAIEVEIPKPEKAYCFYFTRFSCTFEFSQELCTVPTNKAEVSDGKINLSWSKYPNGITNLVQGFNKVQSIERNLDGKITIIPISGNRTEYQDSVGCFQNLSYKVIANVNGRLSNYSFQGKSISNKIEIPKDSFVPSKIENHFVSINEDNVPVFSFSKNPNWPFKVEKFFIHTKSGIDSVLFEGTKNFKDLSLPACFQVSYMDECKRESAISDTVCNIQLAVNGKDELTWNESLPFSPAGISKFEIQYRDEISKKYVDAHSVNAGEEKYLPNLEQFENEARFRLMVLNQSGQFASYSNWVSVPLAFNVFLPQIFSPNGDGINDHLKLVGNKNKIEDFDFSIFNRNGWKVFNSTDKDFEWNGMIKNSNASSGQYIYKYSIKLLDGTLAESSGLLELIR